MRIDRIDIDIDGWPSLSGSFNFPATGLGLWAAPGNSGKSLLPPLIATALYGTGRRDLATLPKTGWIMIRLTTGSGEKLVLARDLSSGTLQITDQAGEDVTTRWADGPHFGEELLEFTRDQFLTVTRLGGDDLANTIGNPDLGALLESGRGRPEASAPRVSDPAVADAAIGANDGLAIDGPAIPDLAIDGPALDGPAFDAGNEAAGGPAIGAGSTGDPAPAHGEPEDLSIFHSAAEEMLWTDEGDVSSSERVLALEDGARRAVPAEPAGDDDHSVLRHLKAEFESARRHLEARNSEYREFSDRLKELQAERDRLGSLDGAEPGDVERLGQLVNLMKKIADRREQLRREEAQFRNDLQAHGVDPTALAPFDEAFRSLGEEDRLFLDGFSQAETVLRGNQALTRSESRLDESRIQEIDQARQDASRMALAPFGVGALGLFGSIVLRVFPALPVPAPAALAVGFLGAVAGGVLLWRGKQTRSGERRELAEALKRKKDQMAQFKRETEEAQTQVAAIREKLPLKEDVQLLTCYREWQEHKAELRELSNFARRAEEIGREAVNVREKLGSFTVSVKDDPTQMSDEQLDSMVDDYVRHFTVMDEIAKAETKAQELEDSLAETEGEIADLRARMTAILEAAEINGDRDLDEAIEIHALRTARPASTAALPRPDLDEASRAALRGDDTGDSSAREITIEDAEQEEPAWASALSARMEAILRRFAPDVRDVEVGRSLVPQLRLSARGPLLSADNPQDFGSGILDQVCLALRLAIVETLSAGAEPVPIFLDDPFVRSDDARHDSAIEFLVEDASTRGQMILLTSHEVRTRWYLHQHPAHRELITPLRDPESPAAAPAASAASPQASSSPS